MNYYTLGDLLPIAAPFVDGGLCADDTGGPGGTNRVVIRLNEAVERLLAKMGSERAIECVNMCMYNGCVTCPRDIEKIIKARIDGTFAHVFDKWYQFLEAGPGLLSDDTSGYMDLIDSGMAPTQYDMPESMRVAVFSDQAELVDAQLLVRGYDETAREVRTQLEDGSWMMGEYIPITQNVLYYSNNQFSQITSIQKPVTNGYVYLSAYDQDVFPIATEITREHLAYYHPDETRPMYRRYSFKTSAYTAVEDRSYKLNALVKMHYIPMSHSSDVCGIANIHAIKMMLKAIRYYNSDDPEKGLAYENLAEKLLLEATEDHETVEAIVDVQLEGWGMGNIESV